MPRKVTLVQLPEVEIDKKTILTAEQYWYFVSLPLEKRRQIVFDNYLKVYPNTLFANQIIIERSNKKKKVK
jgi:hypothetical protein